MPEMGEKMSEEDVELTSPNVWSGRVKDPRETEAVARLPEAVPEPYAGSKHIGGLELSGEEREHLRPTDLETLGLTGWREEAVGHGSVPTSILISL